MLAFVVTSDLLPVTAGDEKLKVIHHGNQGAFADFSIPGSFLICPCLLELEAVQDMAGL